MTLPPPLTLPFWFNPAPPPFLPLVDRLLLVLFVGFVVIGVLAHLARLRGGLEKMTRRAISRAGTLLITMGLFGLLLWAFLYERVSYLSMRFWYLVWLGILIWWVYSIYKFVFIEIPQKQDQQKERDAINKWLPKSKK
ncbi:hypothetical protein KBC59_00635 [Patescibacteria group bacterium]|jgi:hypothetical protein|nr:hypothetical protein [Patescibacteria group bacterium]